MLIAGEKNANAPTCLHMCIEILLSSLCRVSVLRVLIFYPHSKGTLALVQNLTVKMYPKLGGKDASYLIEPDPVLRQYSTKIPDTIQIISKNAVIYIWEPEPARSTVSSQNKQRRLQGGGGKSTKGCTYPHFSVASSTRAMFSLSSSCKGERKRRGCANTRFVYACVYVYKTYTH